MAKQQTKTAPEVEEQTVPPPTVETHEAMTLAAKILLAKSKIGVIVKDGSATVDKNGKKVQYATLSTVLGAITPVLAEIGVDYVVAPVLSDLAVSLMPQNIRIFSLHFVDVESGETSEPICYPFRMATNYDQIKADGSTITYATRYLLGLALGLQTEEDPDARFDNNGGKKQPQPQQPQPQQPQQRTNNQQPQPQQPQQRTNNQQPQPQQPQQRTNNQQPQPQPQQPQQPKKQRTFRECVNGFYATYNKGDLDGARRTLDFVRKNWERAEECAAEIAAMEKLDLTVWQPTTQQPAASAPTADANSEIAPF